MDPLLGTFLSPDTIIPNTSDPQNLNRYMYVLGNPINATDPTGHYCNGLGHAYAWHQCLLAWNGEGQYARNWHGNQTPATTPPVTDNYCAENPWDCGGSYYGTSQTSDYNGSDSIPFLTPQTSDYNSLLPIDPTQNPQTPTTYDSKSTLTAQNEPNWGMAFTGAFLIGAGAFTAALGAVIVIITVPAAAAEMVIPPIGMAHVALGAVIGGVMIVGGASAIVGGGYLIYKSGVIPGTSP